MAGSTAIPNRFTVRYGALRPQQVSVPALPHEAVFSSLLNFNNMKNKMLALGAAVLLISGLAFGFTQTTNTACCDMKASTCNGEPCPAPDQCPIPCCETGSTGE